MRDHAEQVGIGYQLGRRHAIGALQENPGRGGMRAVHPEARSELVHTSATWRGADDTNGAAASTPAGDAQGEKAAAAAMASACGVPQCRSVDGRPRCRQGKPAKLSQRVAGMATACAFEQVPFSGCPACIKAGRPFRPASRRRSVRKTPARAHDQTLPVLQRNLRRMPRPMPIC